MAGGRSSCKHGGCGLLVLATLAVVVVRTMLQDDAKGTVMSCKTTSMA